MHVAEIRIACDAKSPEESRRQAGRKADKAQQTSSRRHSRALQSPERPKKAADVSTSPDREQRQASFDGGLSGESLEPTGTDFVDALSLVDLHRDATKKEIRIRSNYYIADPPWPK